MSKLKGLGRGLDALLKKADEDDVENSLEISTKKLIPGRYQPRRFLDQKKIDELSVSVKEQGIIQPILVRKSSDNKYEIIAGERRWRAAKKIGLEKVPVIVKNILDKKVLEIALVENIQREDLSPIEEALAIQRLINEFNLTHDNLSETLGKSRSAVTNTLRLLKLSENVQEMVIKGLIDMGHARVLVPLNKERQNELASKIIALNLSVREVEKLAKNLTLENKRKKVSTKNQDLINLEENLTNKTGYKISINEKTKNSGELRITYYSLEELNDIIDMLKK